MVGVLFPFCLQDDTVARRQDLQVHHTRGRTSEGAVAPGYFLNTFHRHCLEGKPEAIGQRLPRSLDKACAGVAHTGGWSFHGIFLFVWLGFRLYLRLNFTEIDDGRFGRFTRGICLCCQGRWLAVYLGHGWLGGRRFRGAAAAEDRQEPHDYQGYHDTSHIHPLFASTSPAFSTRITYAAAVLFPLTVTCVTPTLASMARQQTRFHLTYHTRLRLMLLPYGLGLLVLVLAPALFSFFLAFFRYDGLSPPVWVGSLNFALATTDDLFLLSVQNTLALIILPVPLRVAGAFLLARLLLRGGRFLPWLRAAIYVPTAVPVVAYALAWFWILNPLYGPLNWLLQQAGLAPPGWFADLLWARPAVALISLWTLGEGFLIMLAALHDMPPALEDAARMDGASGWAFFRHISLPLLAPVLLLLTLRDAILILQESFTTVLLTTGGGPYYATYTLPILVFEQAYDLLNFGVASAALWFLYLLSGFVVITVLVVAWQWRIGLDDEGLLF